MIDSAYTCSPRRGVSKRWGQTFAQPLLCGPEPARAGAPPARSPNAPLPASLHPRRPPPPLPGPAPRLSRSRPLWLRKERERTESKTSWRPTVISCTFCKCHRVKINRPPLRPAGSPRAHDSAPCPGSSRTMVLSARVPQYPRTPRSSVPRHSVSQRLTLLYSGSTRVSRWPSHLPLTVPYAPISYFPLCPLTGADFSPVSTDSGILLSKR